MGLSTAYKNSLINKLVGITEGTCYLGLATAAPTEDSAGNVTTNELTGGPANGYTRLLLGIGNNVATQKMSPASNGSTSNTVQLLFGRALENWGTITHVLFFNAATGGQCVGWAPLQTAQSVGQDYVANFDIGSVTLSFTDA